MALNFLLSTVCKQCLAERVCLLHMFILWHDLAAGPHYCRHVFECLQWRQEAVSPLSYTSSFIYSISFQKWTWIEAGAPWCFLLQTIWHLAVLQALQTGETFSLSGIMRDWLLASTCYLWSASNWRFACGYVYVLYSYGYAWMLETMLPPNTWSCCVCSTEYKQ